MNNEIKELFERVAELTGYETKGERNDRTKDKTKTYYKKDFLHMDYNSIYGGYVLMIVLKSTGETAFGSYERKTKKEMISYLRGIITGLTYNK